VLTFSINRAGHVVRGPVLRTAQRQLREWQREPWLAAALLAIAGLGLVAGVVGAASAARQAVSTTAAQDAEYQRWLAQPPRDPHSASHFGLSVFHVPPRLAALDPGVSAYAGGSLFLEAHRQNEPVFPQSVDGGALQRLGTLHPGTLLQVWLPLVVIIAAAGAFAAEREQGTLAQLISLGVSPLRLAWGKMLAAAAVTAAVAAPGVIAALVMALVKWPSTAWPYDTAMRLGALAAGYALYLGFWVVLTVIVSAASPSWRLAAAALTACWCVTTIAVPRLALEVARVANPLPSRAEIERIDLESRMSTPEQYARRRRAILDEYGVKSAEELPVDFTVIWAERAERRINARIDQRIAQLGAIYRSERADYLRAAWLSPAVAVDLLSMAASGTDDVHYRAFLRQAEDYRREMMAVLERARSRKPGERGPQGDANLWRKLPPFAFTSPPLTRVGAAAGATLAVLAGWLLGAIVVGSVLLRRIGPR
jgi:ABC-2 type transport system permease protein